uniref:Uncharacterized protein n=1 Tax=Varanus komodoensis TaxID=61221 RepID=A0A8D2IR15_VARKO
MACLTIYCTLVPGSREIKSQEGEVTRNLNRKQIKYSLVNISQDNDHPKAIPPQVFNGDHFCGDYEWIVGEGLMGVAGYQH